VRLLTPRVQGYRGMGAKVSAAAAVNVQWHRKLACLTVHRVLTLHIRMQTKGKRAVRYKH